MERGPGGEARPVGLGRVATGIVGAGRPATGRVRRVDIDPREERGIRYRHVAPVVSPRLERGYVRHVPPRQPRGRRRQISGGSAPVEPPDQLVGHGVVFIQRDSPPPRPPGRCSRGVSPATGSGVPLPAGYPAESIAAPAARSDSRRSTAYVCPNVSSRTNPTYTNSVPSAETQPTAISTSRGPAGWP